MNNIPGFPGLSPLVSGDAWNPQSGLAWWLINTSLREGKPMRKAAVLGRALVESPAFSELGIPRRVFEQNVLPGHKILRVNGLPLVVGPEEAIQGLKQRIGLLATQDIIDVRDYLTCLTNVQLLCFVARYAWGMGGQKIQHRWGISKPTAERHIVSARERVLEYLGYESLEPSGEEAQRLLERYARLMVPNSSQAVKWQQKVASIVATARGASEGPEIDTALRSKARPEDIQVVDQLSPTRKAAFVLRYGHRLSCEEIGAQLGITPKTAKLTVQKARRVVRGVYPEHLSLNPKRPTPEELQFLEQLARRIESIPSASNATDDGS